MAAVVHHGGAGTVAAGLRFGKPTFVCPFFGDQHFWGAQVHQSGVGPPPCPIVNLTTETLVAAFTSLMNEDVRQAAVQMKEHMAKEDGIANGLKAFYKHLPVEHMMCDVSPLLCRYPYDVEAGFAGGGGGCGGGGGGGSGGSGGGDASYSDGRILNPPEAIVDGKFYRRAIAEMYHFRRVLSIP